MGILQGLALAAFTFSLAAPVATAALAARHVALIIGNDQYENLPRLQKAVADAHSYADVLKAKGFDQVIVKSDLTRGQLDEAIASFLDQIEPGDTAVFAYSGHGWSDGTQNYIVGTDAPATGSQDFLARISIPLKNGLNGIMDEMDQKGASLKVAIIDACRDNPFTPQAGKRSIGLARGMVRIDPPSGTFVVFSAGAGQSALDRLSDSDANPNSVFTRVFVPAIQADMTLQQAIKTTQEQVVALAKSIEEDQKPAYYDEVIGSACLSAKCNSGVVTEATPPPAPIPAIASPASDAAAWQRIATSSDPVDFESFARVFPDSAHKTEADARAKSLRAAAESRAAATTTGEKANSGDAGSGRTDIPGGKLVRDESDTPGARPAATATPEANAPSLAMLDPNEISSSLFAELTQLDSDRLKKFDESRRVALGEAKAGDANLFKVLADLVGPEPQPVELNRIVGKWRCRTFNLGGSFEPLMVNPYYNCQISRQADSFIFQKTSGGTQMWGKLRQIDGTRTLYYGVYNSKHVYPPADSTFDEVGILFSLGPNRLRLELPLPVAYNDSHHDVIELTR